MKILYVSNGNIVYDLKFIKKMLEYNYIVGWVRFNIVNEEELKKISKIENLKIYYLKFPRLNNYFSNKINQISTNIFRVRLDDYLIVKDLKKIIYEFNPDILYGGWVMYEGYFCAKVNFHPFLLMPWGTDILIEPFKKINKFKRIRWTIQKADMITCDCEYQKEYVCKIGQYPEEKVITFPWGIDLKIFYKRRNNIRENIGWLSNDLILVCSRNFHQIYGHIYLFNAFKYLSKKYENLKLLLIGDGELKNSFKKFFEENELLNKVYFTGLISQDEMANYLSCADIYVNASLSDGVSCSMLEAMACGLPVVTTDIPVNYEWIINYENGFIVPRKNIDALIEKIEILINNKNLRNLMSTNNIKKVKEKADWNKNFDVLNNILIKLYNNKITINKL